MTDSNQTDRPKLPDYDYDNGCYVGEERSDWPFPIGKQYPYPSTPSIATGTRNTQESIEGSTYVSVYNPGGKPDRRDGFYDPTDYQCYPKLVLVFYCRDVQTDNNGVNSEAGSMGGGESRNTVFDTRILFPTRPTLNDGNKLVSFRDAKMRDSAVQLINETFNQMPEHALSAALSHRSETDRRELAANHLLPLCQGVSTLIYDPRFNPTAEGRPGNSFYQKGRPQTSVTCLIKVGDTTCMLTVRGASTHPNQWTDGETCDLSDTVVAQSRRTVLRHEGPHGSDALLKFISNGNRTFAAPDQWPFCVIGTKELWSTSTVAN